MSGQKKLYLYRAKSHQPIALSPREVTCIVHLLGGKSAKGIGKCLQLSYRTIETYLAHLKDKLGCDSREELIAIILSGRLMSPDEADFPELPIIRAYQQIHGMVYPAR